MAPSAFSFEALRAAVVDGDAELAASLASQALSAGVDPQAAIEHGFSAGIREVGELWEEGEYFLPELIQGAEAMQAAMDVLRPALDAGAGGSEPVGTVVIGTVQGDLHDIGKSLVATLLSAHGFEVHDLGADVSVDSFVERVRASGAQVVAASALLTTTMPAQKRLVDALASAGLDVRVMVGGAPTSPGWAAEIGAHHAENAQRAVELARALVA